MVGGRPLVVTAVGQHLPADLATQPLDPPPVASGVAAGHRQPDQGLEVFDQMVATDVGLQVRPQEGRVPAEVGADGRLGRTAPRERLEQPAQRPRAQGGDIGRPRGAGARRHQPVATACNELSAGGRRGVPAAVDQRGGPP